MSSNAWARGIDFVLSYEGGFSDDKNDSGNWTGGKIGVGEFKGTNFGISAAAYPNVDIKDLTVEEAKTIYRRDYWNVCHCDDLPDALAIAVFDCAVNQGPGRARRLLQISLDVVVDGNLGPKTLAAAARSGKFGVLRFIANRNVAYHRTMVEDPRKETYALNWFYRMGKLTAVCLEALAGIIDPAV